MSLRFLVSKQQHLLPNIESILFFVDSIVASRFSSLQWIPTTNFDLCKEIHDRCSDLRSEDTPVEFRWVPSHVGVSQNEMADRLAEQGAAQLEDTASPIAGQPAIPHSVSKGMLKSAIWCRQLDKWMHIMADRAGCEHLSRVQLGVRPVPLFFIGSRRTQTTLARLRFGHVNLNAHLFRFKSVESPYCACGDAEETVSHYLIDCVLYENQRRRMMQTVCAVLPVGTDPTENILLGGSDFRWGPTKYKAVAQAVCKYVEQTCRF